MARTHLGETDTIDLRRPLEQAAGPRREGCEGLRTFTPAYPTVHKNIAIVLGDACDTRIFVGLCLGKGSSVLTGLTVRYAEELPPL